ncbi:protein SNORC [Hippoglossus stenolepis]|uniref:protein SNORC n=1 Tax=Hippoglossus stenolepis TaxID=195615 RepID=UPI00159C2EF8|nr:protein SNORC [Hippoglossus stenolepis]
MMFSQSPQCPDHPVHTPTVPPLPSPPALPYTPLLLLCRAIHSFEVTARGVFGDAFHFSCRTVIPTATMVHSISMCRVFLLMILGLLVAFVHTETVADPASTTRDNQDTMSGEPPSDVTTRDPFQDMTEQSFTNDYEDATHSQAMDEEEGVLGPGAITAIVIAVFLGASVLLALIVITLRKFTAS